MEGRAPQVGALPSALDKPREKRGHHKGSGAFGGHVSRSPQKNLERARETGATLHGAGPAGR